MRKENRCIMEDDSMKEFYIEKVIKHIRMAVKADDMEYLHDLSTFAVNYPIGERARNDNDGHSVNYTGEIYTMLGREKREAVIKKVYTLLKVWTED